MSPIRFTSFCFYLVKKTILCLSYSYGLYTVTYLVLFFYFMIEFVCLRKNWLEVLFRVYISFGWWCKFFICFFYCFLIYIYQNVLDIIFLHLINLLFVREKINWKVVVRELYIFVWYQKLSKFIKLENVNSSYTNKENNNSMVEIIYKNITN